jgi:hypothetical protein
MWLNFLSSDLCLRFFQARLPMVIVPQVQALHRSRGSVKGKSPWRSEYWRGYHHAQSKLIFARKHSSAAAAERLRRQLIWQTALALPLRVLLFSPKWLLLYPGILTVLAGGLAFLRLLAGPVVFGGINFDLNTLEVAGLVFLFGYQMILFACFARIYAFTHGLLPPSRELTRAFKVFTLEKGLIGGGLLLLAGLGVIGWVLMGWAAKGYGDLDPQDATRTVIAGRTLASIGFQTVLFSLIFSYLGLNERPQE